MMCDITTHEDKFGRVGRNSRQTTHMTLHMARRIEKEEATIAKVVVSRKAADAQAIFEINLVHIATLEVAVPHA